MSISTRRDSISKGNTHGQKVDPGVESGGDPGRVNGTNGTTGADDYCLTSYETRVGLRNSSEDRGHGKRGRDDGKDTGETHC